MLRNSIRFPTRILYPLSFRNPLAPYRYISTMADSTHYQLQFYVPKADTEKVLAAIHATGAGEWPGGLYGECAFISAGTGTFRPLEKANPAIGKVGEVEKVEENKVEVLCVGRECMLKAVKALRNAHPYEQIAFFVFKAETVE